MRLYSGGRDLRNTEHTKSEYPLAGILTVAILLYGSMLLTRLLVYPAFVICIYRIVRYDARVFSMDYCILLPVSTLFQTAGGMSLLVYVCLFAAIWYVFRNGVAVNSALLFLVLLLNYMFLRMQMEISKMVLFFGQLLLLYVLLPAQDSWSAEREVKAFCISLMVSSVYALIFRNNSAMLTLRGKEVPAYWGSSLMRFQGLFEDPNYYMMLLLMGTALLVKLRDCRRIDRPFFLGLGGSFICLGILTYSKTFLLVLVMLAGVYILWQFRNRKFFFGSALAILVIAGAAIFLLADFPFLSTILSGLFDTSNISNFTTGRTDIYLRYWNAIVENPITFLFGCGFAAPRLIRDTHNLYLEMMYYSGVVGLTLIIGFYSSMVHMASTKTRDYPKQNIFAKYAVLLTILTVFMALHGVFSVLLYGMFYLAFLSILLTKNEVG